MKLILLPGMDGTGDLFNPLVELLPVNMDFEVLPLPEENLTFSALATTLAPMIGDEEVVLLAESFSGKIAYELCKLGLNIRHVIFLASFINRPSSISNLAKFLPVKLIKNRYIPSRVLSKIFFNNTSAKSLVDAVYQSLDKVTDTTIENRLKLIASMETPKDKVEVSASYIRPSHDLFVRPECVEVIKERFNEVDIFVVDGGHFIAQVNPVQCSEIIDGKMRQLLT